jgi:hypothetical protein
MPDHPNRFAINEPVLFRTADSRAPEWTEGTVKIVESYTESRRKNHNGIYEHDDHTDACDGMYYTITAKNHNGSDQDYNWICVCQDSIHRALFDATRWGGQMLTDLQDYKLCWINHARAGRPLTAVPQPGNDRVALFSGDGIAAYANADDLLAWAAGLERHPARETTQLNA